MNVKSLEKSNLILLIIISALIKKELEESFKLFILDFLK